MAMTVRIPELLDRQLDQIADRDHVSKHALLLQGAELLVKSRSRRDEIDAGMDFVLGHDAQLLRRLEDA